ncbi:MAG: hypothetical protein AB7F35_16585 [Acetobacteraceae bacterium]
MGRTVIGAGLFGFSAYISFVSGTVLPGGSWRLGLVLVIVFAVTLLVTGLRHAMAPRDGLTVFWCLAALAALWWLARWVPGVWGNIFGRAVCIALICATLARLYLALRGISTLPVPHPGTPHGAAEFAKPHDPGFKL